MVMTTSHAIGSSVTQIQRSGHFHQNCSGHDERDRRQQLIRDCRRAAKRIDSAERIDNALIKK